MSYQTRTLQLLPVYHYQFRFTCPARIHLPEFPGSAWRGAFGHALKRTVCVVRDTPCAQCLLKSSCAYSYVFETPPPRQTEKMRKYNASPHPFVLQLPLAQPLPERYALNVIAIGHGQRFFPYIVHAMQQAGKEGIGSGRQVFLLESVAQQCSAGEEQNIYQKGQLQHPIAATEIVLPAMPRQIEITIHTPLRIKQQGHNLNPQTFTFGAFFGNLLRRISMLSYFHSDSPLEIDFSALTRQARRIEFSDRKLRWYDWKRYSSRQQSEMNMGGVVGSVCLRMQGMEAFWPYLWLGQWTHAGKGTSMGMGHYSIESTSLPDTE